MLKKIGYVLLAALVIIQFIQPQKNNSKEASPNHINTKFPMNDEVAIVLKTSCYDCHSNNTNYPWYSMIQPVGWWLQDHVNEGKGELNFDEFASYSAKKQKHKLEEINETISKGEMPLDSYTWIHKNAILSAEQKAAVKKWVDQSLQQFPPSDPEQQSDNNKQESH